MLKWFLLPLSQERDFYGNHSSDTQGFHSGLLGFLLVSVGFSLCLACMRSCLKNPNCISSLRRDTSINLFSSASPFMSESFHRQIYIYLQKTGDWLAAWSEWKPSFFYWTNSFIISGNCSYKEVISPLLLGIPGWHSLPVPTAEHQLALALPLLLSFPLWSAAHGSSFLIGFWLLLLIQLQFWDPGWENGERATFCLLMPSEQL